MRYTTLSMSIAMLFMTSHVVAQDAQLNLRDVLGLTLDNDQRIEAARFSVKMAQEGVFNARAYYRPTVNGIGNFSVNKTKRTNFLGTTAVDGRNLYGGVEVTQELFGFGRHSALLKESQAYVAESKHRLRVQEDEVLLEAARAYLEYAEALKVLDIRKNYADDMAALLELTQDKFDNQLVGRSEYLLVRSRYQQSQAAITSTESLVTRSFERLSKLIDMREFAVNRQPLALFVGYLPNSVEDAIAIGKAEDPYIMVARETVEAKDATVRLQKANKRPKVSLRANTYRGRIDDNPSGEDLLGLNVEMPIYSGGVNKSRIRRARSEASRSRALLRDEIANSRERIIGAWKIHQASEDTKKSWQQAFEAEAEAVNEIKAEVDNQLQSLVTLLEMQEQLVEAEISANSAGFDYLISGYELVANVGRIQQLLGEGY